ncbi:SPOR domain-containing protein [Cesiribacter andamanensis]|uniref:SPOR domain-containing protein n=1 Tax=Cesiribacter andamanensis AMV16 TaxID=1279009 RepID=M7NWR1_9BACT|nr:SPOR domain-containing protein [Cesiribacter andamanensis]EMR02889.1 hypothetical protein ADICEAN_01983 [Cesiribacter andamanensis AMV16]
MIDQEKLDNQEETITFSTQQDDEYGLPEAEFSPIGTEPVHAEPEEPVQPIRSKVSEQPKQSRSTWPVWVGVFVLLGLAGFFLYFFVYDQQEAPVTPPVVQTVTPQPEPEPIIEEPAPVVEEEWTPAQPAVGQITTISGRTGRYYVIVGSFIDSDMAADYAVKLSKQGHNVTIIEPVGDRKFYRLGVKEGDTFSQLSEELDTYKSTFGQDIWVVRY